MRSALNLVCIFICISIYAQNERDFSSYTTREGLSNNFVRCVVQDNREFLWLGTLEGLNRFDGHSFKKFFKQQKNPASLSDNYIWDILEYKPGQLLIATNNGLSVLNTLTGQFQNEKINFASLKAGSGTPIYSLYMTPDGQIWINHNGELDLLDSNLNYLYRFTDLPWAKTMKGSLIYASGYTDREHRLWFTTDTSGIQIIDFSAKQVWNYKNNPQHLPFLNAANTYNRSFLLDEVNNILWYAPWGQGLIKYDLVTHKEQQQLFGLNEGKEFTSVNAMIQKNGNYLLCAVGDNVYEVDINTLSYTKILKKIGGAFIHTTDNKLWQGTAEGLVQLKDKSSFLKEFLLARPGKPFIPDECTGLAIARSGRMYVAYGNNIFVEIEKDRSTVSIFSIPAPNKLFLYEVCEDKAGQIWIGTSDGVFLFDAGTKKFSRPVFLPKELRGMHINIIYCDHSGEVWIGTRRPFVLYRVDAVQKNTVKVTNAVIDQFTALYQDSRISAITEDKRNNLWMSSYLGGGIINFNKTSGLWKRYPTGTRHKNLLADKGLLSLYADENYNFWFTHAYSNVGLICYNYLTDSLRQYTRDDGLASDYIDNMVADLSNNLWMSAEYSITQFNIQNHKTISFNLQTVPAVRLQDRERLFDPVTNSLVYALDDRLLFIEINKLKKDTIQITPFIDRITVNNKELFIDATVQKPILNHEENNISIEFTGVDFSNAQSINFAYQLSGLDTGWRFSDANRSAQYANLAPGHYIFKIKTANENSEWSKVYEVLSFTIMPVFWQTTWFRLSVFLFIVFLVFWFIRRRIKTIRWEAGIKHKLSETEMLALRSQMNPHFIFNCLNAIDNLIQTNQADKATIYLARFAKLIRSVLESTKNNVVPFDKDFETLELFLELEQFRCNNKFTYEINAEEELLNGDYKVPPLIIQPFVENAIHHGLLNKETGERKVMVKASLENNFITYIVQDNGVGRIKAEEIKELNKPEHQSYGIQITSERIHLHNQNGKMDDIVITDLIAEDGPVGTAVKVKLKIH